MVTIPEEQVDKDLPARLTAELPGILAWAVHGCLAWQQRGLDVPAVVRTAVDTYRAESDSLGAFLEECCEHAGEDDWVAASELYAAFCGWAKSSGERPVSQKLFGQRLTDRGYERAKHGKARLFHWHRLRLTDAGRGAAGVFPPF